MFSGNVSPGNNADCNGNIGVIALPDTAGDDILDRRTGSGEGT
jgi:hypothetical protein